MRLSAALILVNGLLLAPWWVLQRGFEAPWLAWEAVVIVAVLAVAPRSRWTRPLAFVIAVLVVVAAIVGLGDTALRISLGRPLNLYLDFWLFGSVRHLLMGTLGPVLGPVAIVAGLLSVPFSVVSVGVLLGSLSLRSTDAMARTRSARLATMVPLVLLGAGIAAERVPAVAPVVDLPTARLVRAQSSRMAEMMNEREWFATRLAQLPESYADHPGLLKKLEGRDVIVGFIESYGVTAIQDPLYAPVVGPRLDDFEQRMARAGLHVVSGRLIAPSQGGQSWFAHGTLLSGIWLDNQLRYDLMLASGRETLIDDFRRLGHRTVAVMPAISSAWPEGLRLGYDEVFSNDEIPYEGPPLNWVTMPDQFTWSFLQKSIRDRDDRPVFAELGLISSHAPWTPVLPVLDDWDSIGDGSVFARFAENDETPEELWLDTDRVREHYGRSVEYAVHAMVAYAERHVDEHTLLVVLGDHQPAPLVTGDGASWEVPVHVISGDPALLAPFLEWGFVEGAWPNFDLEPEPLGVDFFRDWFVRAYSER